MVRGRGSPFAHLETFKDFFKVNLYSDDSFNNDSQVIRNPNICIFGMIRV